MTYRAFALAFAAFALSCSARSETTYGQCRASSTCNESTPLCIAFRNRVDGSNIPLCTRECATNAECPDNGVCIEILAGGYRSLCMQRCLGDTNCPFVGGFCADVRAGDRACVP
ncbi:MAG: hypothetical protein U0326_28510 [Polyangiales bacterium]